MTNSLLHDPLAMYALFAALTAWPVTRILARTGLSRAWALLLILPVVGFTACTGVLALSKWKDGGAA